jgi:hypothetical protein
MVDPVALAGGVFLVLAGLPAVLAPRTTATVGDMDRFGGVLLTFLGVVFVALAFQSPGS